MVVPREGWEATVTITQTPGSAQNRTLVPHLSERGGAVGVVGWRVPPSDILCHRANVNGGKGLQAPRDPFRSQVRPSRDPRGAIEVTLFLIRHGISTHSLA